MYTWYEVLNECKISVVECMQICTSSFGGATVGVYTHCCISIMLFFMKFNEIEVCLK